jgi:hypothetical protein
MRLRDAAVTYSALTFTRSAGTLVLRIVLVIGYGLGITGVYLADLALTLILWPLLWRWIRPLIAAMFSTDELRQVLRFGLPRLPHGLAQQSLESTPKLLLGQNVSADALGVYQNGSTLGTAVRFFTSAFETAWAPFYYATSRKPDAKQTFGKMTTYGVAVLVSYLTQLVVAFVFAQRQYPIEYEVGRLIRLVVAGVAAALAALWLVPALPPVAGLIARGVTCIAVYGMLLWITGFFRATEIAFLREIIARFRRRSAQP